MNAWPQPSQTRNSFKARKCGPTQNQDYGQLFFAYNFPTALWHLIETARSELTMTQGNPMTMQAPIGLPAAGAPLFMQPAVHPPMLLPATSGMPFSQPGMAVSAGIECMSAPPGTLLSTPMPGMFVQGNGGVHPEPACGIGRTGAEYTAEQMDMAYANKSFEPQDFKPADDTPSRMYMCRELDGVWTMRSRFSIDRMAKEWRWHMAPEGYFYAVRLPN